VELGLEFTGTLAKDATQLEKLEIFHAIHDMYLWLGGQFEGLFVDLEKAQEQRKRVSDVIQQSILSMSDKNLRFRLSRLIDRPIESEKN
jgi:hypothetical protein